LKYKPYSVAEIDKKYFKI